jgi:hypothetical protein
MTSFVKHNIRAKTGKTACGLKVTTALKIRNGSPDATRPCKKCMAASRSRPSP